MSLRISWIDAFTHLPFTGNPAAVCLLPDFPSATWMQSLAAELRLSETAFLVRRADGFALRWFTPAVEVDLCGHATLASAHFLWQEGELEAGAEARFHTRSGPLSARLEDGWIELDFPSEAPTPCDPPSGLEAALGFEPVFVGWNGRYFLLEAVDEEEVRELRPDFGLLESATDKGLIVTARSRSPQRDFVSRFFAPGLGVAEDPVTGSAHCCLGPFWGERLGKSRLVGHQVSARGGVVRVGLAGPRVRLAGRAVTVLRGDLLAEPS